MGLYRDIRPETEGLNKIIMRIIGGKTHIKSDTWPPDKKVVLTEKCWQCDTCLPASSETDKIWFISTHRGLAGFGFGRERENFRLMGGREVAKITVSNLAVWVGRPFLGTLDLPLKHLHEHEQRIEFLLWHFLEHLKEQGAGGLADKKACSYMTFTQKFQDLKRPWSSSELSVLVICERRLIFNPTPYPVRM